MSGFRGPSLATIMLFLTAIAPVFSVTTPDCFITMQIQPDQTSSSNCLGELAKGQEYQISSMECALKMIANSNLLVNESGKVCIKLAVGEHAISYSDRIILSDIIISGNGSDVVILTCSDEGTLSQDSYTEFPIHISGQATVEIRGVSFRECARPLLFSGTERVTLEDCSFSGFNESAVELYNTPFITIINCSFTNNTSNGISPTRNSGNAGAMSIGFNETFGPSEIQPQILIQDCNFAGNKATDKRQCDREILVTSVLGSKNYVSRGGAIGAFFAATNVISSMLVERCNFTDNKADDAGGAAYINFSGAEGAYTNLTFRKCDISRNTGNVLSGGIQLTSETVLSNFITIEDCIFTNNEAGLGGAIKAVQIHTQGNLNQLRFIRSHFSGNNATVGAAIHVQSPFLNILNYNTTQIDYNRTSIDNCSFTENHGRDIVYISHNHCNFSESNFFRKNTGSSIRAEGSLLSFSGELLFEGNTVHPDGTSGTVYLSSYGQILLNDNVHIVFVNNFGREGAAIVVSFPLVSITFGRTLYNAQCFLQFANHTIPPIDWINHNVSLEFRGNEATIAPVLFITSLDACSWFNNSDRFFNNNLTETWSFMTASDNYVIHNGTTVDKPELYIQTEVQQIQINTSHPDTQCDQADVCAYPGQDIQINVVALDEEPFMHQTSAFLRIIPKDPESKTEFSPSIVQTSTESDTVDISYNSSEAFTTTTISVEASFSATRVVVTKSPFSMSGSAKIDRPANGLTVLKFAARDSSLTIALGASPAEFTVFHMECLPGFQLDKKSRVCECAVNRTEVLFCDPEMKFVLLQNGRWGAPPQWSRTLVSYPCPPGYCNCTGSPNEENSTEGCALIYSRPFESCNSRRKGILCGECREPYGVGMLTTECQEFTAKYPMYYWLIPLLIICIIVSVVIIVKAGVVIPSVLLGFLFYVQISALAVAYIHESFTLVPAIMDCFHSFFALYVPYNFPLHRGLTALEAYGLKFIPPVLVLILSPIVMRIRYRSKSWRGVWTLVLLMYAMTVQTSASLLFCPTFTRDVNRTTESITVWFFDGSVTCYQGAHLALAIVAALFLILAGLFIPVSAGIVCQKELGRKFTYFDRRQFEKISHAFTDSYKEVHRWWVPIELIRRYVIIIVLIFEPGFMTLSVSLIGGTMVLQWFVQPYKYWWTNLAEAFSVLVLTVVMCFGDTNQFVVYAIGTDNFLLSPLLYLPLLAAVVCFFGLIGWEIWKGLKNARSWWQKRVTEKLLAESGRKRSSTLTTHIYKRMSTQTVSINDSYDDQDDTSRL